VPLVQHFLTVIRVFDTASEVYETLQQRYAPQPAPPETNKQWIEEQRQRLRTAQEAAQRRADQTYAEATRSAPTPPPPPPPPEPPRQDDCPYRILGLSPEADDAVVKAAYRAMMKTHHPDAGGNGVKAKQLSGAFDRIKRERKW